MMGKLMVLMGTLVGGWIGWAVGDRFGMMAAMLLSLIGSAAGLYWTRRLVRDHLG
jgi:hypothetical protein